MTGNSERLPTQAEFSQQVGNVFRATASGMSEFDVALVECNNVADDDVQETFSLLFRAPGGTEPRQTTYNLVNDCLGKFDIFLVPVKRSNDGLYFEAVFNRLKG